MSHCTDEELLLHVLGNNKRARRMAIETHILECQNCAAALADLRAMDEALADDVTWAIADEGAQLHTPPASYLDAVNRLERELAEARQLVTPLADSILRFTNAGVASMPAMHTVGGVHTLCTLAEQLRQRQPSFALLVAETAVDVATQMKTESDRWTPALLGIALREQAAALYMTGNLLDAERTARRAESAYDEDLRSNAHDLAMVWLIRALVCAETERVREASTLAASAAKQFRIFGDTSRALTAEVLHGNALFIAGDYRAAAEIYEAVISAARPIGDRLLLARSVENAAVSYTKLGENDLAEKHFLEALALWDELGADVEKVRNRWGLASVWIARGDFEAGLTAMYSAAHDFEASGAYNDVALVRLEIAETLLAIDRPDDVPDLLRDLVVQFASDGMTRNANLALAYLREAVSSGRATPNVVRDVRLYLETLPSRPESVFSPVH